MFEPTHKQGPMTQAERWLYAAFLIGILGLFAAEVFTNYEPIKLRALLFVVFWVPLLVLHEAGHAAMAALVGWRVGFVVIGMGRTLGRFRIGQTIVEIRMIPVEGFVRTLPANLNRPGLKNALIYFAGPGVELLLAGAIAAWLGVEQTITASSDYRIIIWQSLALTAAAGGVLNLIPHSVQTPAGPIPNDGLGILLSFLLPRSFYAELMQRDFEEIER